MLLLPNIRRRRALRHEANAIIENRLNTNRALSGTGVRAGSALLDRYFGDPTWDERIDLDRLDITSLYDCVVGQLFGSYSQGIGILAGRRARDDFSGIDHGFAGGRAITDAWRHHIRDRQMARTRASMREPISA